MRLCCNSEIAPSVSHNQMAVQPVSNAEWENLNSQEFGVSDEVEVRKPKSSAKVVEVSIKIYNISEINSIEATFQTSIKLFFRWTDPKLIGHEEGHIGVREDGDFEIPGLFNPDIQISNEFELHETSREFRLVDSKTGKVKLSVSYRGKMFMMDMGLKYFPFDGQNLQIMLRPHKLDESKVVLEYSAEESASDYHPVHEWRFIGFCAKRYRTDPQTSSTGKTYSSLHIVVCVQRESAWFVSNIILPTFILTMVSWATFGLYPAHDYGVRLECSIGAILATIENKFVVADHLPKVPYRTLVDIYLDVSFFLQVISVLACIIVGRYADPHSEYNVGQFATDYLNLIFFLFELAVYAVFHLWYFWLLYEHNKDIDRWENSVHDQTKKSFLEAHQKNLIKRDAVAKTSPSSASANGDNKIQSSRKYSERIVALPVELLKGRRNFSSKSHIDFQVHGHMPVDDEEYSHHKKQD